MIERPFTTQTIHIFFKEQHQVVVDTAVTLDAGQNPTNALISWHQISTIHTLRTHFSICCVCIRLIPQHIWCPLHSICLCPNICCSKAASTHASLNVLKQVGVVSFCESSADALPVLSPVLLVHPLMRVSRTRMPLLRVCMQVPVANLWRTCGEQVSLVITHTHQGKLFRNSR